jgi:hypothetical protein
MIISLRGTNGAGKSTIVRTIMNDYRDRWELRTTGRRKPVGYRLSTPGQQDLFIPGHYEIANGGIDTLRDLNEAYELITEYDTIGCHVLYEGKNMSDGTQRISLFPTERIAVIVVRHPIEGCIASVRARGHSIREESIRRVEQKCLRDAAVLSYNGFRVRGLCREDALEACRTELRKGAHDSEAVRQPISPDAQGVRASSPEIGDGSGA